MILLARDELLVSNWHTGMNWEAAPPNLKINTQGKDQQETDGMGRGKTLGRTPNKCGCTGQYGKYVSKSFGINFNRIEDGQCLVPMPNCVSSSISKNKKETESQHSLFLRFKPLFFTRYVI